MNCRNYHKNLTVYLEGDLKGKLGKEMENHLQHCEDCSIYTTEYKNALEYIKLERKITPDPFMFTRILAATEHTKKYAFVPRYRAAWQTVLATVIITVGIYSGILLGKDYTTQELITSDFETELLYVNDLQYESIESILLAE